jgi:hypothetical protein
MKSTKPVIVAINKMDLLTNRSSSMDFFPSKLSNDGNIANGNSIGKKLLTRGKLKKLLNISVADARPQQTTIVTPPVLEDTGRLEVLEEALFNQSQSRLPILSKEDLAELWQQRIPRADVIFLSALAAQNIDKLRNRILHYLPLGPKYFPDDQITNRDERFFTCEIIRESIFHNFKVRFIKVLP